MPDDRNIDLAGFMLRRNMRYGSFCLSPSFAKNAGVTTD